MSSHVKIFVVLFAIFTLIKMERSAWAKPLDVLIQNEVDDAGNVNLLLTLKNSGSRP